MVRCMPTIATILMSTDFSPDSELALDYAEELARRFSAEVVLLHVDQPLPPVALDSEMGLDLSMMSRIAEEQRLEAQRQLDRIVGRLRDAGVKSRSLLRVGAPFVEILAAAQSEHADLIVMGTHGRTGLAHVLLGSVADRVVQRAQCPVLTVRHPDRSVKSS
jgi:universal stress protein A